MRVHEKISSDDKRATSALGLYTKYVQFKHLWICIYVYVYTHVCKCKHGKVQRDDKNAPPVLVLYIMRV